MIIVDASVVIKWYFPEAGSDAAIDLLGEMGGEMLAPDLLAIEVCAALVRKGNMDKAQASGILTMLNDFHEKLTDGSVRLSRVSIQTMTEAANLALNLGHPLKDCIYLVLAMELDCELVTCDARFAAKAKDIWPKVRMLTGA